MCCPNSLLVDRFLEEQEHNIRLDDEKWWVVHSTSSRLKRNSWITSVLEFVETPNIR